MTSVDFNSQMVLYSAFHNSFKARWS